MVYTGNGAVLLFLMKFWLNINTVLSSRLLYLIKKRNLNDMNNINSSHKMKSEKILRN